MIKNAARASDFYSRSGSAATLASRTGRNLLGWGAGIEEGMDPQQKINCLNARLFYLQGLPKEDRKLYGQEMFELAARISELKPKAAYKKAFTVGLERFMVDVFKERLSKAEFSRCLAEAIERKKKHDDEMKTKTPADFQ